MIALIRSPYDAKLLVELLGLRLADGRIERRHDADDRRLALQVGRLDRLQPAFEVVQREIGGRLADLHRLAGQGQRVAFERDCTLTCHD